VKEKLMAFLILFSLIEVYALEVIKFEPRKIIELRIIRAEPDSFETYSLMNFNGREMTLVCANNITYDKNAKAFIEYRNFYNEIAGRFEIEDNKACLELGRFIENVHSAISEEHPFVITLSTKDLQVRKLVYPKVDPFTDVGEIKDLLPKPKIPIVEEKIKPLRIQKPN
jgi:hypothetical protein